MHLEGSFFAQPPAPPLLGPLHADMNESLPKSNKEFLGNADQFIRQIKVPTIKDLSFQADDIPFSVRSEAQENGRIMLTLWCSLGYLPYSVDSIEKRHALIQILENLRSLPHVHFGVDAHMKIVGRADFDMPPPSSPEHLFLATIQFLQHARPFIRLIGQYL